MKQLLNISSVGRIIVFVEILMCAVYTLSVFMVNGADAITEDHLALFLLLAITITSAVLLNARSLQLNKMAIWIGVLPLLFISYEAASTFFVSYEAHSLQHGAASKMAVLLSPVR